MAEDAPVVLPDAKKAVDTKDFLKELQQSSSVNSSRSVIPDTNIPGIKDFVPPHPNRMRERQAAHSVSDEYIAKYKKATELMRALPDEDPWSFKAQAKVHGAYCCGKYKQVGFPECQFQVHDSWLFFPFHRCYLYFYERILGKLLGDEGETFALPFWNWDSEPGMQMPIIYSEPGSPLYDNLRNADHQPPTIVDLNYDDHKGDLPIPDNEQIFINLRIMYRQMINNGKTAELFLGHAYRAGDQPYHGRGSIENVPHNTIHDWCGDKTQPHLKDMGYLCTAGYDPIFFAHHSNVDRLWEIWNQLGCYQNDVKDLDWLNSGFVFYDENRQPVFMKVRDCLDITKLGYRYQEVDIPWLEGQAMPRRIARAVSIPVPSIEFPLTLDKVMSTVVLRPKKSRSGKEKEEEHEKLVIEGIEYESDVFVKFDVHINEEDEPMSQPHHTEFAGSFVSVAHGRKHRIKTNLMLGITELLKDLGAENDDSVVVTLVPRTGTDGVTIDGIKIEFTY